MSINEIAKKILHLRETKMTGYIMAGVLREELGFEGYGEALRNRWIEADMEQSGMVTISNNLNKVEELRRLAAECKDECGTCHKAKCSCDGRCDSCDGNKCTCESQEPKQESLSETAHFFAQAHAFRRNAGVMGEDLTLGIGRTGDAPDMAPPGLSGQSAPAAPTQRTQPQAAAPTSPSRPQAVGIGNDVAVVEGGKQYVGKVSRVMPDGKYEISFAGEQPSVRRAYDKSEVTTTPAPAAAR